MLNDVKKVLSIKSCLKFSQNKYQIFNKTKQFNATGKNG